jgi:hypothetical protein
LAPAQALGVGNVVDIREEYTSDDEDKDERSDAPVPRVAKSIAAAAAVDDAEEERRMARLMELLALEEEEERREKEAQAQALGAQPEADKEPHGTKRPKSCLKGDSLDVPTPPHTHTRHTHDARTRHARHTRLMWALCLLHRST